MGGELGAEKVDLADRYKKEVVTDKPGGLAGDPEREMVKGQSPEFRFEIKEKNL